MKSSNHTIVEEKNIYHDNILDVFGNEFKFDHQKGISEWIKNSADGYIRAKSPDSTQFLFVIFTDGEKDNATIEVVDFVGMTKEDIEKAFKVWGDPNAANRGLSRKMYGGHGNGGKFYMRQMFKESYFITFREGKLNVFGFSQNKKYGFAKDNNREYKNLDMGPKEALEFAGIDELAIPDEILKSILNNKTGFTVVRGITPFGMTNKIQSQKIIERLRNHPQARRLLERMKVLVVQNNKLLGQIIPDKLIPKKGFETPFVFDIPEELWYMEKGDKQIVKMTKGEYPKGSLTLHTSEEALERNSRFGELNRVDFLGEIGVIASYQMYELGVNTPQSVFIYGDCSCPILEDPEEDCVKNDRSKLVAENPKTKALLQWVSDRIFEISDKIADKEREEQKKMAKDFSRAYNELLNNWSSKFLNKIRSEILISPGEGIGVGLTGTQGSSGGLGNKNNDGKGGKDGSGSRGEKGGGGTPKRKPRFPRVLLSSMDPDPLNVNGDSLQLDPRHPVIYQRLQDVQEGIYWINTSSPLAKSVLEKFSEKSQQWRSYLFQRYVDIFIKEELRNLYKRDSEFNPDVIDSEIFGRFVLKIHEAAALDLESFLLEERYEVEQK